MRKGRGAIQLLLLTLLLCGVFAAQTSTVFADSLHQHSSQHCCGLCHAGTVSFAAPAAAASIAPIFSLAWVETVGHSDTAKDELVRNLHSRAPPL
jgi:hypothetical protein